MASSTGFQAPPDWNWPEGTPGSSVHVRKEGARPPSQDSVASDPADESEREDTPQNHRQEAPHIPNVDQPSAEQAPPRQRHYGSRTCRICLEAVEPTFHPPSENVPSMFQGMGNVTYDSEDGGRLLRPCLCKGSQKYVHEGCLQAWRYSDAAQGTRNYYQCPTCKYKYRLDRMTWSGWISSLSGSSTMWSRLVPGQLTLCSCADHYNNLHTYPDRFHVRFYRKSNH